MMFRRFDIATALQFVSFVGVSLFAATTDVIEAQNIHVVENFLNSKEVEYFQNRFDEGIETFTDVYGYGHVDVPNSFVERVQKSLPIVEGNDVLPATFAAQDESRILLEDDNKDDGTNKNLRAPIREIYTGQTPSHMDKTKEGVVVDEYVSFVFLNDNPDATFVYGGDHRHDQVISNEKEVMVPVVAGNLVTFRGNIHHYTIVKDGKVDLLGPFRINNKKTTTNDNMIVLESVGGCGTCFNDNECDDDRECVCGDGRRVLNEELDEIDYYKGLKEESGDDHHRVRGEVGDNGRLGRRRFLKKKKMDDDGGKDGKKGKKDKCPNEGCCRLKADAD